MAAVLCKKNICTIYEHKLSVPEQTIIKQILLQLFFSEPVSLVKKSIGVLIGFVATIALENNNWIELLQEISKQTQEGQSEAQKKGGLELLAFVLDSSGDFLGEYYG
ncbi:MAG: hypothetical protein ACK56I_33475 [bacterium]